MTLSLGLLRSGLLNRRINQPANQVLRLHLAFSSASPSPSDPSAAAAGPQTTIREGKVEIFLDESNSVFYNKTQVNNRDISIAVLRSFILKRHEEYAARSRKAGPGDTTLSAQAKYKEPKVLEALAASGLRAIRYAVEVDGIGEVTAVDNNEAAVEACKKNIQHNGSLASSKVVPHHADARVYMLTHPKEFDVVDLDPYGSPAAFLDSAVQCVADGGILMCSATDMAVLAGGNAEVCFSKYGSYPLRGKHCHEMALRILLACIESHAIRHKRYIVPIISVHMDFYIRVFVRIFTSASTVKSSPLKLAHVYQCTGCNSFYLQNIGRIHSKDKENIAVPNFRLTLPEVCSECGHQFVMGGPLWSYPIHDKELLEAPLFVSLHNLCAILKCTTPTMVMLQCAIRNAGYQVSGSHVDPLALKTDAPMSVIWDIMRCWVKLHPVKHRPGNHPGNVILSQEPKFQAKFSRVLGASVTRKRARFMPNPEKYWGPGTKAGRNPRTFQMDNRN
ncbi:probable tRNA (guanine(26)-N(2))-dimethyltransferase 2-like isoform X3 [Zea mays]|uniref:probable tRNA (guanine(26)-N(2))-dimethyltransferase 2-like isoform X3 n=1 Tax=Zea mays TaxID=4577 RepID=UPI0004DEC95F|nr:uncharacterized protein LOC100274276 isoform X3 [Zea mays]|eukprot:XP_008681552.1 uncharacterized protein LOC100274276 isoform X4 [Zea mays]